MNQNEVYQKTCSYYAFSYGSVRNNDRSDNGSCKITNKADFQHCVTEKENYNLQWKNPASGINCKSGKTTLKNGKDYVITYKYGQSMKTAGKKTVYINGIGRYAGFYKTVAYTINPAVQKNVKVSRSSVAVKRGKATTIKLTKAKAAKATWTSSNSKAVKVSKTGKITVAKNAKKGKYTVKVTVKLANHKTVTRTVKVTVK